MNERDEVEYLTHEMAFDCQAGMLTLTEVQWLAQLVGACCEGEWPVDRLPTPPRISGMLNALAYANISSLPPARPDDDLNPATLIREMIAAIKPRGEDWKGPGA